MPCRLSRMKSSVLAALAVLAPMPGEAFTVTDQPLPGVVTDHDLNDLRLQGAVSWDTLRELEIAFESPLPGQTSVTTSFTTELQQLDGQEVKLVGFLYPLEAGETHERFLLSAFPPGCPFCLPGGPTDLVDVESSSPVPFSYDPIVVIGRFELLIDDDSGLLYRLHEARLVP
jgi:uncharacterized protein